MRSIEEILADPIPVFKFKNPGDSVTGIIQSVRVRAVTDMKTGSVVYWQNGDPREQIEIVLLTPELEEVRVFVKAWGDNLREFRNAVGSSPLGANLTVSFTGEEADRRKNYEYSVSNARKSK